MDFLSELSTFHSERARIDIDTPFRNGEFQLEYQNKWLEMECFETKHNFSKCCKYKYCNVAHDALMVWLLY